ncbi:MAG: fibronectin type III domain-containing protein [Ignavibacterium sp.]|nr:fibronectin type III domain-containing protein [Ignavibacterium sp.]MCX7611138.1 fibronectin type III domain-containing protein [Ignavibacterium sp.]MDW8375997.1 fibronectin type III domain-containing protein [Ignavibacteriales bacterium]
MKNLKLIFSILTISFSLLVLMSCSKEEDPVSPQPTPKSKIKAPTNPLAYSLNNTTVVVKWTRSQDENLADFDGYLVRILTTTGSVVRERTVSKGLDSLAADNLTAGTIYNFQIVAKAQSNSTKYINSDTISIQWSPAWRFDLEGTIPIKIYESSSSTGFASGLIFYNPSTQQPKTVSLLSADSSLIDVYLYTVPNSSNVELRSSHLFRPSRKITRFSTVSYDVNTLNDPRNAPPDTTTYTKTEWRIDSVAVSTSKVLYFKGNNGNYGRILLERNPANGTLIWGSSPEQYIQVRISYQSVPYNRFSKTR